MSIHLLLAGSGPAHTTAAAIGGYVLGTGRTVPSTAAVLGLIGVVAGGLALARSVRRGGDHRAGGVAALVLGLVGLVVGAVHAANAAGGPGTGNGLVGAVAAVALGLVAAVLGGLVLARSRRGERVRP
jgi:uncharacterized protein DUF6223